MHDPDWIHEAVERYERPLVAYVSRLLGGLEPARDVVQDGFLRLCRQDRSVVEGHLAEWLFTVCRNLALDQLRRQHREVVMDTQDSVIATVAADDAPPSQALEQAEAKDSVLKLLATLPARQQELVRLRFQQGLSYKQIAAVTNLTATNVGFLIHTAIKALHTRAPSGLAPVEQEMNHAL